MPESDSLRRLGGGRWETRDGRFAIEPQSGTWVIVDNEQTDDLGLPLVRGPFGSLTAAKVAIEAARTETPKPSPLAAKLEKAGAAERGGKPKTPTSGKPPKGDGASRAARAGKPPKPEAPELPPEPRWLRELDARDQRRARDLIARLGKMGVDDPERIARSEIADGQPALARLAIERSIAKNLASAKSTAAGARAAVKSMVRGADVELGVSWQLVDGDGRRIEKVVAPDEG
jgi:hypothetical protein